MRPATSGGLLISVAPERAETVLRMATLKGFASARRIGRVEHGPGRVRLTSDHGQHDLEVETPVAGRGSRVT